MKKYIKNKNMEYIELDETETVINDTESGSIHYIDQVSTIILQQLEEALTFEELIAALLELFEGDEGEIRTDTAEFLTLLVEKNIIHEVEDEN